MKIVALIAGVICVLLGGLWLLQGLGAITMAPLLCFANCTPIEGPSSTWAAIGLVMLLAGAAALGYALKRRASPKS